MVSFPYPERYVDVETQLQHRTLHAANTLLAPLSPVLPPGVSAEAFSAALDELIAALGNDGVFTGQALEDYVDPYELWEIEGRRRMPSAAVCPISVEQIQSVVAIARQFKIPLWTISRGKNLGYGGPAPRVNGSICLDLHRMNKIIEVNEEFSYAVVEPGVTFIDLYNYCREKNLRVWPSAPSLGWGSVIGNSLDRGIGFLPTGNHHQHFAGLEVVLGNGEVMHTGQFAISNSPSAHLTRFAFGPELEGLFLQSNMGVVTKMGFWLTPQPHTYMSCVFDMPDFDDIETMVEVLSPLRRNGVITNTIYVSNLLEYSSILGPRTNLYAGEGPIPESRLRELQKEIDIGYWNARFGLYGQRDLVEAKFNEIKRVIAEKTPAKGRLRGTMYSADDEKSGLDATTVSPMDAGPFVGIAGLATLPMVKYRVKDDKGVGAHCDISPIIPSNGSKILEWVKIAKGIHEQDGFDMFCDFHMHERHVTIMHLMAYDKADPTQRKIVDSIWHNLYKESGKLGYGCYRSHVNHMDEASEMFDWNNHAYRRFLESVKDALDPDGILSPGKMGVWPMRFRQDDALKSNT